MTSGQQWPDCSAEIRGFVTVISDCLQGCLGQQLDAIYLHGSLAMGCFYPPKSDIDLLAVVNDNLTVDQCRTIHQDLLAINDQRPITGAIELSIVTARAARTSAYPVPYELHFGENLESVIRTGSYRYLGGDNRVDVDLAAHFMVTKYRGITLFGESPELAIGNPTWQNYLDSVLADLDWILAGTNILSSPYYGVLNACRVLQMFELGEGTVSSKEEAALWALQSFPLKHQQIIRDALACYQSPDRVPVNLRKTGGRDWDHAKLLRFRDYVAQRRIEEAGN